MTSLSYRYEDFGVSADADTAVQAIVLDEAEQDEQLSVFEKGYEAGWEDATNALQGGADNATLEISQRLQDMSFTHREAATKLNAAMQPLISQIINKLLPKIAQPIIGSQILEQIIQLMGHHVESAIEITVAPESLSGLQAMLEAQPICPFMLVADPSLQPGQVYLRVNNSEREINFDAVLAGISEAFDAFYEQTKEQLTHG